MVVVKNVLVILSRFNELGCISLSTSHESSVWLSVNTSVSSWRNTENILASRHNIVFLVICLDHQTILEVEMGVTHDENLLSCIVLYKFVVVSSFPVIFLFEYLNILKVFCITFDSACLVIHVKLAISQHNLIQGINLVEFGSLILANLNISNTVAIDAEAQVAL